MRKIAFFLFLLFTISVSLGQIVHSFQKTYGLLGYNYGRCSFQTDDGGYIILGNKTGFTGGTDIYLIKTDTLGEIIWDKAIGGSEIEWANDFKITHDKGYIIAGYTNALFGSGYDVLLLKTDSMGIVQWSKVYGGTDWDIGNSVIEDKDHNFLVAGETYSNSFGDADVYLIKTDSIGDTIWTKHYGGTGTDIAYSIDTTYKTDYIVAGITREHTDTAYSAYLLKIKSNGDTTWTKKYSDTLDNKFYCARQIDDSSYIVCGSTENYGALNIDPIIIKTDTFGNQRWMQLIGGSLSTGDEEFYDIKKSWTNGLIAVGYTTSFGVGGFEQYTVLTDNAGWFILGPTCGGVKYDIGYSVNLTKDSCYIYTGTTESYGIGLSNIYFIKSDKTGAAPTAVTHEISVNDIEENKMNPQVYPNPSSGKFTIVLNENNESNLNAEVINILGQKIFSKSVSLKSPQINEFNIDLTGIPGGLYLLCISSKNYFSTVKIVIK